MKQYKIFITIFFIVLTLYIIAEVNRPKPISWKITLSKGDKNPYGGYVLFNRLKDIFPNASVESYRMPVYNQLNNFLFENTAYILGSESLPLTQTDVNEMVDYVSKGNYAMVASSYHAKPLLDTLKLDTDVYFSALSSDSVSINFTDSALKDPINYTFKKMTLDEYFSKFDSSATQVLGVNHKGKANFLKIPFGDGAFFVHANPLVFSNYFLLKNNNAAYTAKVLSYLPAGIDKIYWDEYYKLGPKGAGTPLRFFLGDDYLRWALRLAVMGMLLYVLFEMKRRQRVIPVITPLRNTTLAFIKTIATVYLQQKDNKSIALRKITYFMEFVRNKYFIATTHLNEEFKENLARKSGMSKADTSQLVEIIYAVQQSQQVPDKHLLMLNETIDQFYKQVQ